MPVQLENTTLSLSEISRLREIVLQTSIILNTEIDPFTIENLNKSDWWQYENARQVLSQTLVAEGYAALPAFSIYDINNNTLAMVLVESINESLLSGGSTSLLLIPTGAIESVDGDYQRFAHDGVSAIEVAQGVFFSVWHAELESTARQAEYQVKVKMPVIDTASQEATVSFAAASITESGFFALSGVNTVGLGFLKYQSSVGCRLRVLQGTTVLSSVEITPTPIAGDEITLTLNADSVDYVHGANTGSLPVPNGFFSATPNVLALSGNVNPALIVPLSIKVAGAS